MNILFNIIDVIKYFEIFGESDEYQHIYEIYLKAKQKEGCNKFYKKIIKKYR